MNINIFCRHSSFPSWSGQGLISIPVNVPYYRNILFLKHLKLCFIPDMQSHEKDDEIFILKMCY